MKTVSTGPLAGRVGLCAALLWLGACARTEVANFPGTEAVVASGRLVSTGPALTSSAFQTAVDNYARDRAASGLSADDAVAIAVLNDSGVREVLANQMLLGAGFVGDLVAARQSAGAVTPEWPPQWPPEWIALRLALLQPANGGTRRDFALLYAEAAPSFVEAARRARALWYGAVAAGQTEMVLQSATDALKAEAELANEQYRAGTISRGERARRHLALAEALHAQANAARDRLSAREALVRALGLWGEAADIRLPDRLPDLPAERPSGQGLEELAVSRRMDLAHARQQGASRQLAVDVRSQVREAHGLAQLAYDVARHQRDVAVPESRVALESAQRDYNGMLIGIFDLLAELRVAVAADTALIEALRDYWIAHSDLTAALGGEPLPNTTPASEVAP